MNERFDTLAALLAFIAAAIGGALSFIKTRTAHTRFQIIAGLFMSGIAGLFCWMACRAFNSPEALTAVVTGLAGNMAAEATKAITKAEYQQ